MGEATRNADISTKTLLATQLSVHRTGGTIDDLMSKLDPSFETLSDEDRKKRIATINVRRSQTLAKLKGEFLAKRTQFEKQLVDAGAGTDDTSNDIREQIRLLNRQETALVGTFKLSRKGMAGDTPGMSVSDMLMDAIDDVTEGRETAE